MGEARIFRRAGIDYVRAREKRTRRLYGINNKCDLMRLAITARQALNLPFSRSYITVFLYCETFFFFFFPRLPFLVLPCVLTFTSGLSEVPRHR